MARFVPLLLALVLAPSAQAAIPGVQAHRGGPVLDGVPTYPEESMPAFRNAAQNLHVVLELDAKLTADGVPVVFHDPTLDRTTNCEGPVVERALADLAACMEDVLGAPGNDLPTAPATEPVPISTLADVLAFAKARGSASTSRSRTTRPTMRTTTRRPRSRTASWTWYSSRAFPRSR